MQAFHKTLISDLYRKKIHVTFEDMLNNSDNKQYFIVPLKMSKTSNDKVNEY